MSNELTTTNDNAVVTKELLGDYLKTITNHLDDNQRMQFCAVAQAFNLNPFKREIYATTYKDKDGKTNMSIVVGYEVYLKRAELNPNFDGFETEFHTDKDRGLSCTCTVYRKDRQHPTRSTVYLNEYSTGRSLWASKPTVMLEKVAICTAFRRSFPVDFGGIPYAPEELSQSTEDKLQQQGFKEVKAEQVVDDDEQKKNHFLKMMLALCDKNPIVYGAEFGRTGYNSEANVPPTERRSVYNTILKAIDKAGEKEAVNG